MPNMFRGEKVPTISGGRKCQKFQGGESATHSQGGENSRGRIFQNLEGEKAPTFSGGGKFPGEIIPGGSKCQMTHGGECSGGSVVKNVEGGVYSRGENELSVRGGEAWYSGGRKCQGGEGLRGEKVCKPMNHVLNGVTTK